MAVSDSDKYNKYKRNEVTGFRSGYVPEVVREVKLVNPDGDPVPDEDAQAVPGQTTIGLLRVEPLSLVATTFDGMAFTAATFAEDPLRYSHIFFTVNGLVVEPADGQSEVSTSSIWVADPDGAARSKGGFRLGDTFRWNGSVAGREVNPSEDEISVCYTA